jgi:hypothetical protein
MSNFMEIRSAVLELLRACRQTHVAQGYKSTFKVAQEDNSHADRLECNLAFLPVHAQT